MSIEVREVHKSYGKFSAVRGVNLNVERGRAAGVAGAVRLGQDYLAAPDRGT